MSHCGGGHKIFQLYVSFPNRCYKYQFDKDRPSIVSGGDVDEPCMPCMDTAQYDTVDVNPWHYVTQVTLLKIHFNLNFCVYI